MDFIDKQIKREKEKITEPTEKVYTELQRKDDEEKITVSLKTKALGRYYKFKFYGVYNFCINFNPVCF